MKPLFRTNKFTFSWQLGLSLILLFGIPRFILVLEANRTANYNLISVIFLVMAVTPFILLTIKGRQTIGIRPVQNYRWLAGSFLLGASACGVIFLIGSALYQSSMTNWFVYISKSYGSIPAAELTGESKWIYFLIFSLIGMTVSPIGEELLYRGLIHQSFVSKFGENMASVIDSLAFATVHLAHFGLIYSGGSLDFLAVPALLWISLMYTSARLFYFCKQKTGSIYGAIASHAGFNFAMTYLIFFYIL
jgi:membrane protease YdiL (CAAX protease family)